MALNVSGSESMGVQSSTGTVIKHAPHIHHEHCGCKYLTKTFFHDHKGVPKSRWDNEEPRVWPFKYIGCQTSDPLWPVRETQPPQHRTANPTKGALKKKAAKAVGFADTAVVIADPLPVVLPAKHRTMRPIKGALRGNSATPKKVVAFTDAVHCIETGQPLPATEDTAQARRRFRFARKALRAAKALADPIPEDEPLRIREPTDREAIIFRNHDLEVEWNLDVAKRIRFRQNWEAIGGGSLDFMAFVHSQESKTMNKIQELVRLAEGENCLLGSYTGDEMFFAQRAVDPAIIHPLRYKNPETAMSSPQDSPEDNGSGRGISRRLRVCKIRRALLHGFGFKQE